MKSAGRLEPKHSSVLAVSSTQDSDLLIVSSTLICLQLPFIALVRVAQYVEMGSSLTVDF